MSFPPEPDHTQRDASAEADELPEIEPDLIEGKHAGEIDNTVPTPGYDRLPLVGLGGSAGSIGALQEFFQAMPADSGMAFVVILHLLLDHVSTLAEMLQRATKMPVVTAPDGVKIEGNCVYVIPPGKLLTSARGRLRLTDSEHPRRRRTAVDIFFRTLADTHGPRSVAILLSGADGDGAIGIKRIKERGGLTIAQDPDEAEHSTMPRAAIATGMVDWVLRVKEIPALLLAYRVRGERLKLPAEDGPHPAQLATPAPDEAEIALRDILAFLHTRTACDFSYYKRATILRRIGRRMQVNGIDDLAGYLIHLRTHTGEAGALLQDLLIAVTNFFRDREAFDALAGVIPELFRGKGPGDTVRVWVAACATGEEAYSIAMLLCEYARELDAPPQLQVFATDLDDEVIRQAREGFYPEAIAADVTEERLRRFFIRETHGYRVRREVREIVLFAPHDLLKDSPFSRLDLVSCRNLLIYLNRDAQKRAMEVFHFALRPGGRLFLGTSETVEDGSALFDVTDKKHRLYLHHPGPRQALKIPAGLSTVARALELQERARERPSVPRFTSVKADAEGAGKPEPPFTSGVSASELHYHLIERLSPPSILVNADHDIVHVSESASRFLQYAAGEPTRNLLRAVHPSLRVELRAALYTAAQTRQPATALGMMLEAGADRDVVDLLVSPVDALARNFLLVVFTAQPAGDSPGPGVVKSAQTDQVAQRLEQALETTRGQLRDTIEQSEASTEELKASNEELQAMNEELRSATEELETSREELNSINEELTTVNHELTTKVDELGRANSDLQNLMSATEIATVFLDRELRIMRFTPSAKELFHFIATDLGRPLSDLSRKLDYPEIVSDAEQALAHLTTAQREVTAGERCFLARIVPYRTADDRIAGVVLTFTDITTRKQAEVATARLAAIVESSSDAIVGKDLRGIVTSWNAGAEKIFGYMAAEMIGQPVARLIPLERQAEEVEILRKICAGETIKPFETVRVRKDGMSVQVSVTISPIMDPAGKIIGGSKIARDISDAKHTEAALRESEKRHRLLAETMLQGVVHQDAGGQIIAMNPAAEQILGKSREQFLGSTSVQEEHGTIREDGSAFPGEEHPSIVALRTGQKQLGVIMGVFNPRSAEHLWIRIDAVPIFEGDKKKPVEVYTVFADVTEQRRQAEAVKESEQRFRHIADAAPVLIWISDTTKRYIWFNKAWLDFTGRTMEAEYGVGWTGGVHPDDLERCVATYHTAFDARQPFEIEYRLRHYDGSHRWLLDHGVPRFDGAGEFLGYIGSCVDISAHKVAEVSSMAAKEAAETANQSKDRFLAVLSHELRTPLTPVLMAVGALEHDPDLRAEVREDLAMIRRNVELETKLIDDLLDLSRITSGKVELKSESVDLNALVDQVCAICRPQLADARVRLETALDPAAGTIAADPARLQQVLWNVLKNAVKFTPAEGAVRVSTARMGPDRCEVRVRDSGIGIPPDVMPRIFNAFEQGDANVTRQFGGLGLGLAISRALVELHGGAIRAESAGEGQGATFIVELPGHPAEAANVASASHAESSAEARQIRLLLVEDHADTARTLARLLRREGFHIVAAADVASAVAMAERETFDLLVSDLGLPDGDGYEIMRAIRAKRPVPGIAMSGYGMEEDIRRSTEAGFTEHLVKPINIPQLIAAIRRVVERG